jgi:NAD(P)-dependent dehydrogenase (short-subunit alcohol dehydrogenase family)
MFDYTARPDLLQGRVILVTGAGRGIGAAAARTFAAHGATVLLLGKNEDNLNQVYDEIEAAGHPQPVVIPFNLETALPHQYDELAATIEEAFGRLDGCCTTPPSSARVRRWSSFPATTSCASCRST